MTRSSAFLTYHGLLPGAQAGAVMRNTLRDVDPEAASEAPR